MPRPSGPLPLPPLPPTANLPCPPRGTLRTAFPRPVMMVDVEGVIVGFENVSDDPDRAVCPFTMNEFDFEYRDVRKLVCGVIWFG